MSSIVLLFSTFFLGTQVSALPQAQPATTARPVASNTISADFADITAFTSLPSSIYAALTSEWATYSIPSAVLASESAAYASYTAEFFRTASPSELSAIAAYDRSQSAAYASWTAEADQPLSPSESSVLEAEYASWTANYVSATSSASAANPRNSAAEIENGAVAAATMAPMAHSNDPAADAITCVSQTGVKGAGSVNITACAATISRTCSSLQDSKEGRYFWDEWAWVYGSGCATGYWMPEALKNSTAVPTAIECETDILRQMEDLCVGPNSDGESNAASVNVAVLPDGKGSTGQQVALDRVSFLLASKPWPCDYGCTGVQLS